MTRVSEFIEFFVAAGDRAAARARYRGPRGTRTTVAGSFFDADDAIVGWESMLTGRTVDELWASSGPRLVAPWHNDASAVFALSDELAARLLQVDAARLRELAVAWSAQVTADGDELSDDTAMTLLMGVRGLAHQAARTGSRVYCRVAC
jgi:hypothetical protein